MTTTNSNFSEEEVKQIVLAVCELATRRAPSPDEEDPEVKYIECHSVEENAIEGYNMAGGY